MSETVKILTANRLNDGVVVYGGPDGGWVEGLRDAMALGGAPEADARLAAAAADVAARRVVEPYLFDAERTPGGVRPRSVREAIRAAGPTVRRDLGKQASQ